MLHLADPGSLTTTLPIQAWTLGVAALAVVATIASALLLRRTGKEQVEAARQAAAASERSAKASEQSSGAAIAAVDVNRETATGVALRAQAEALARRYQNAAEHLGHISAPVRLAGVYAMARLADDWGSERQTCVDVLCAYLRMPWTQANYESRRASDEYHVRQSIVSVINSHLEPNSDKPWHSCNIDLSGALLVDFRLWSCRLESFLNLFETELEGETSIIDVNAQKGASFSGVKIRGDFTLNHCRVEGGRLSLNRLKVEKGASVLFHFSNIAPNPEQATVMLRDAGIEGDLELRIQGAQEAQGEVHVFLGGAKDGGSARIDARGDTRSGEWPHVCLLSNEEEPTNGWMVAEELSRERIAHVHVVDHARPRLWELRHSQVDTSL